MLRFPCFQTNFRIDGGMSGGPVFDAQGHLCGLLCSSLKANDADEEHASYVTLLWPSLAAELELGSDGTKQRALDVARRGGLKVRGLECIQIEGGSIRLLLPAGGAGGSSAST